MENKRHKPDQRNDQAYIKWLQKIVYDKEK
jgi:hypothetical protein